MELEKSLEDGYCKNLLTKLWVLSLEKKMLRGSLLTLYNCLKGGYNQKASQKVWGGLSWTSGRKSSQKGLKYKMMSSGSYMTPDHITGTTPVKMEWVKYRWKKYRLLRIFKTIG
ncbi:hypothetical protein HGM15179_016451 [Zosterops borbonicus]|uniref:Uncharacterized protein n=1 Tax=Zosterops borbonicus TaxID=364589 RepID=A0A8K1G2T3_9PASS|nr:hypothetical protein HGM15179_016451 [Zosterops borbonicus]